MRETEIKKPVLYVEQSYVILNFITHTIHTVLMNTDEIISQFEKRLIDQQLSKITIRGYLHDLRHFCNWLEEIYGEFPDLSRLTAADLSAYRSELVQIKRQKATSVNRRLQSLKRFFDWATQTNRLSVNPAQGMRFVRRMPPSKPSSLNRVEMRALFRAASQSRQGLSKRNGALLQLMVQAGLRVNEVAQLQYRDLTLNARSGQVRIVEGKGLKEREIPLNTAVRRALMDYLKTRGSLAPDDPVFLTKRGSAPSVRALQCVVETLAKRAKILRIHVTPHTLRHTFAVHYIRANPGGIVELATLLGHDSLDTTAIYLKATQEQLKEGVEKSEVNLDDD